MTIYKHQYNGILLFDKPLCMSSHHAVALVRKKLNMQQIGHAGTLDPMASGLLILMVGAATKVSQYLILDDKTYQGTFRLGEVSTTYDTEGTITQYAESQHISTEELTRGVQNFTGTIQQTPPMFSAKKVNGKKLYLAARKGKEIKREAAEIKIHDFKILNYTNPNVDFQVHCSKGTYIRSLAHDFGQFLKCGAYLAALRRIQSGEFHITDALTNEEIDQMPPEEIAQKFLPFEKFFPAK